MQHARLNIRRREPLPMPELELETANAKRGEGAVRTTDEARREQRRDLLDRIASLQLQCQSNPDEARAALAEP